MVSRKTIETSLFGQVPLHHGCAGLDRYFSSPICPGVYGHSSWCDRWCLLCILGARGRADLTRHQGDQEQLQIPQLPLGKVSTELLLGEHEFQHRRQPERTSHGSVHRHYLLHGVLSPLRPSSLHRPRKRRETVKTRQDWYLVEFYNVQTTIGMN